MTKENLPEAVTRIAPVSTIAEARAARVELRSAIAATLGLTVKQVRIPRDAVVLTDPTGATVYTAWAEDQDERIRATPGRAYGVRVSRPVLAWLAEQVAA